MRLTIGIDADRFARGMAHEVAAGGLTVVDITERLLGENMLDAVVTAIGDRLLKAPQAVVHPSYFKQRFATLHGLSKSGYETWYPEVRFSTRQADEVSIAEIDLRGIESESIKYGGGVERMFHFFKKQLRTQTNHLLRLNKVRIPGIVFDAAIRHVPCGQGPSQPLVANLALGAEIVGFRLVAFDHVLTGQRVFCACHRSAHEAMLEDAKGRAPDYVRGSWPHKFVDALCGAEYVPGVCHLCLTAGRGLKEAIAVYGDSVQSHPEGYIDLLVRRDKLDPTTAKADVNARLGIARWVHEAELYRLVKKLFPDVAVCREASPVWLGRQRLDIYVPDLHLAIEYQGEQHYSAVSLFGGHEALERTKERDLRKRSMCVENGVTLVDVRSDEPLTIPYLRQRLRKWVQKQSDL